MENLIPIFIVVILAVVGVLVYMGLRDGNRDPLQDRLAQFGDREAPESLEEIELSLPFKDRVLLPIMRRLSDLVAKLTPQSQIDDTRKKLELAGMAGQIEPTTFFAMRIGATLGLALLAFMVFFVFAAERNPNAILYVAGAILYVAGGAGLGFILPVMWLQSKISRRQENILRALPDALDLLSICVEAGLGFDQAMGKIYEKWDNDLAIAFGRVLREIQLGKLRREALRDMAERMQVPDITSFTAAVIQADQLGVSLNKILRVQSDQMRVKRRQRAQEKAHQAPVKMIIPMVLLIFPSLWIVLLGPAVISLLNSGALGKI